VPTAHSDPRTPTTRRVFCIQAGQAVSLVTLGSVLTACSGSRNPAAPSGGNFTPLASVAAAVAGNLVTVTVAGTALATVGASALVQSGLGNFLVTRSGQSAFSALTATCTHEQCTVSNVDGSVFVCPCHGSRFGTSGTVLNGPATTALRQFGTQFDGMTLTITT